MYDDIEVLPAVCTVHFRFVPCRKGEKKSPCKISDNPKHVEVVRNYQDFTGTKND